MTPGDCSGMLESAYPFLSLESPGLPPRPAGMTNAQAMFGRTLAVGDFNGDGAEDLVIHHRQLGPSDAVGAHGNVLVLPGSASGPSTNAAIRLVSEGLLPDPSNAFGESIAVADFNSDGFDDLAIGAYGFGDSVAGKVYIFHGGIGGINPSTAQIFDRGVGTISGVAGNEDSFGFQLVAGHFDADAYADLAIAAGRDFQTPANQRGVVHVLFGTEAGLTDKGNVGLELVLAGGVAVGLDLRTSVDTDSNGIEEIVVTPHVSGSMAVPYACLAHDLHAAQPAWSCFGAGSNNLSSIHDDPGTFAAGDFDGDGLDELISGESAYPSSPPHHGSGRSLRWQSRGNTVGIVEPEAQVIESATPVESGQFGNNHAAADLDRDGYQELLVGESGWSDASVPSSSGRVHIIAGTPSGLELLASQFIDANTLAGVMTPSTSLQLGRVVVAGDFNADGCADVALGVPARSAPGLMSTGGVFVLKNKTIPLFRDGFDP